MDGTRTRRLMRRSSGAPSASAAAEASPRAASAWATTTFPAAPTAAVSTQETFDEAFLTPFSRGLLRNDTRPDRWIRGAVHTAEGALVPASQRVMVRGADRQAAADPLTAEPGRGRRLSGQWVYGGHWHWHFGHFITETLTNLWVPPAGADGLVAHRWSHHDPQVVGWQQALLDAAGYADLPVEFARVRHVSVERLVVPQRPYVLGGWALPEAVAVWRRVATSLAPPAAGDTPRRVYFSRTRFNAAMRTRKRKPRTSPEREAELDRAFERAGFEVIHPEEHPIAEQVQALARAEVVAGVAGSALHLAAFAPAPTRVIEIGDERSPLRSLLHQQIINAACGHEAAFIRGREPITAALDRLGL